MGKENLVVDDHFYNPGLYYRVRFHITEFAEILRDFSYIPASGHIAEIAWVFEILITN